MLELIIFYLAMLCNNPSSHEVGPKCIGVHFMMATKDDGETGDIPPPPPPIPHP